MEKINFITENGETCEFYIEEQTRVNGIDYLLVSDSSGDEAQAFILKDMSDDTETEARYEFVDDDMELETVGGIFAQILDGEANIEM